MARHPMLMLIAALLLSLIPAHTPVAAAGLSVPPLPRGCGRGAASSDNARALCCVSGYVYWNGVPVADAVVTLSLGGQSVTVRTRREFGASQPSFFARLDSSDWLSARPGDTINITASYQGQQKTQTFVAHEGGQQEDVVLAQAALVATWTTGERADPSFKAAAMAYDAARQRMILFGGLERQSSAEVPLAETWAWDGRSWTRLALAIAPPARSGHTMAYDTARQRVLLFGGTGAGGGALTDSWEWDGTSWRELGGVAPPAVSGRPLMVYDSAHARVLLVGTDAASPEQLGVWAWDGTDWVRQPATLVVPARTGFGLAYDADRDRVVLFGGLRASVLQQDVWEYDGATWRRAYPLIAPSARSGHAMTYDPARGRVLLIGGIDAGGKPLEDTWAWDGTAWNELRVDLPPRAGALLTYDSARNLPILAGGYSDAAARTYPGATWELDGIDWSQRAPRVSPAARYDYQMAYQPERKRVVLFSGRGLQSIPNDTWEWDGLSWTPRTPLISPPFTERSALIYDEANHQALLFGGIQRGSLANTTWIWDGHTWAQLAPSTSPAPRDSQLMIYNRGRQRIVLFGGRKQGAPHVFNDTWEWDGVTWSEVTPGVSPEARLSYFPYALMAYDLGRGRTVLFHSGSTNHTWEWDGTTWAMKGSPAQPPDGCLIRGPLAYDSARQRVTFFGYATADACKNKMYEWDGTNWSSRGVTPMPAKRIRYGLIAFPDQQLMLFGGANGGSYPAFDDTWLWDGTAWNEQLDDSYVPTALSAAAMDYRTDGDSILFGGRAQDGSLSGRTFHWQGSRWLQLAPATTPPARQAHQIVRNRDGSRLLMFGGTGAGGTALDDTWLWEGADWHLQAPASQPPARSAYSLTFDTRRNVWILFGGASAGGAYLSDTWEYDGATWRQINPADAPPSRAGATLTYDQRRGVALTGVCNVRIEYPTSDCDAPSC